MVNGSALVIKFNIPFLTINHLVFNWQEAILWWVKTELKYRSRDLAVSTEI